MCLKWIKLCLLLLISFNTQAQVVNIERMRLNADSNGLTGDADMAFSFIKVNTSLFRLVSNAQVVYRKDQHQVFFIGNMQWIKSTGQSFANSGFLHTRYQNPAGARFMGEAFHQIQYNRLLKVKMRNLIGGGVRFEVFEKTQQNKLFLGAMLMNEIEVLDGDERNNFDMRWSYYIAHRLRLFDKVAWNGTVYYQPLMALASDFRLSLENSLLIDLTSKIQFKFDINLFHDSNPPQGVIKETYAITNGIRYRF